MVCLSVCLLVTLQKRLNQSICSLGLTQMGQRNHIFDGEGTTLGMARPHWKAWEPLLQHFRQQEKLLTVTAGWRLPPGECHVKFDPAEKNSPHIVASLRRSQCWGRSRVGWTPAHKEQTVWFHVKILWPLVSGCISTVVCSLYVLYLPSSCVCLSVRLSQVGVLLRWLNLGWRIRCRTVAPGL